MLYTASRACLQHPDVAAYKANRDLIYKQLQHAVSGISNAAQATSSEDPAFNQAAGGGELAGALNNFDVSLTCLSLLLSVNGQDTLYYSGLSKTNEVFLGCGS